MEVDTPAGPARVHLTGTGDGLLLLGHGAGGGVDTADLRAAGVAGIARGLRVGLVEQPYRVRGQRMPDRAPVLDAAWLSVCAALAGPGPLVVGGRSSGARVACRTAGEVGTAGVVCLAFPLEPPGRPGVSRAGELALPPVPVLVVQGDRDAFGLPGRRVGRRVHVVAGADHALRTGRGLPPGDVAVRRAVSAWLGRVLADLPGVS